MQQNLDRSQEHNSEFLKKKNNFKRIYTVWIHLYNILNKSIVMENENGSVGCQELGSGEGCDYKEIVCESFLRVMKSSESWLC